ncbi:hypothetical protein GCM10009741_07090 [Kribbella lupini]|uniref:Uncharacterized protein n=1 Tax=Kribbella lupini TaxID=291602 RepID=A0ABN2A5Z0_9ACTN
MTRPSGVGVGEGLKDGVIVFTSPAFPAGTSTGDTACALDHSQDTLNTVVNTATSTSDNAPIKRAR